MPHVRRRAEVPRAMPDLPSIRDARNSARQVHGERGGGKRLDPPQASQRLDRGDGGRAMKRSRVTLACKVCGVAFEVITSRANTARFCSRACCAKNEKQCAICGKPFVNPPSGNKHFCSAECRREKYRRERLSRVDRVHLRSVWRDMVNRCDPEKATGQGLKYYAGRIHVCDGWQNDFEAFYQWSIASGYMPGLEIDRRNTRGDYTPENCRWATRQQQMANTRKRSHGKSSKFIGVSWSTKEKKWIAQVGVAKKGYRVGSYKTEIEAARCRDAAAHEIHGEFASLNFPEAFYPKRHSEVCV